MLPLWEKLCFWALSAWVLYISNQIAVWEMTSLTHLWPAPFPMSPIAGIEPRTSHMVGQEFYLWATLSYSFQIYPLGIFVLFSVEFFFGGGRGKKRSKTLASCMLPTWDSGLESQLLWRLSREVANSRPAWATAYVQGQPGNSVSHYEK